LTFVKGEPALWLNFCMSGWTQMPSRSSRSSRSRGYLVF